MLITKTQVWHTQDECSPTQQLVSVDVDDPLQAAPPQLGVELVQERVSVRVAYPQEEDQEEALDHDVQPPSIAWIPSRGDQSLWEYLVGSKIIPKEGYLTREKTWES